MVAAARWRDGGSSRDPAIGSLRTARGPAREEGGRAARYTSRQRVAAVVVPSAATEAEGDDAQECDRGGAAMITRRWLVGPAAVVVVALVSGGWLQQRSEPLPAQARMLEQVMRHISERYVDVTRPAELYEKAIDGMLSGLGDPHTSLLRARDFEAVRLQTQGDYGGIGAQIGRRGDWVTIIAPMPETPAERAGLRAGDRVVAVDGESAAGWTSDAAVQRLRGAVGTAVDLRVLRSGVAGAIDVRLVREEIRVRAVPSSFVMADGIGYIELNAFTPTSTRELRAELDRLRAAGVRGVILDLRRNPGGLLEQGISVSDVFLGRGQLIAETRGRAPGQTQRAVASGVDAYPELLIAVLIGPGSASAAEIVAGALQDHDRAVVVGRTSYGKGLVQTIFPLQNEYWLRVTTARWYTPAGRSIEPRFVAPGESHDVAATAADAASSEALPTYRTAGGRLVYGGGGIRPDLDIEPDTFTVMERPFVEFVQHRLDAYFSAKLDFALDFIGSNPALRPDFVITQEMHDGFYAALREAGAAAGRAAFDSAVRWIELELGSEIAYLKWGETQRRRRQTAQDAQVMAAVELLTRARSTEELLALAAAAAAQRAVASGG
jgi:carboxyl-terminal processing protease